MKTEEILQFYIDFKECNPADIFDDYNSVQITLEYIHQNDGNKFVTVLRPAKYNSESGVAEKIYDYKTMRFVTHICKRKTSKQIDFARQIFDFNWLKYVKIFALAVNREIDKLNINLAHV